MDHNPEQQSHQPVEQRRPDIDGPRPSRPRPQQQPSLLRVAPVSMIILFVNIAMFVVFNIAMQAIPYSLTFSPANGHVFPGIFTHMFMHGSTGHIMANMFVLFFLGATVEMRYRGINFLFLYIVSGLLAALAQAAFDPSGYLVGASGALAGVMAAFVRHYPNVRLYLYFILPLPAWLVIAGWMAFNIWGASAGAPGIAFVAHIAGFVAGMILTFIIEPFRRKNASHHA